MFSRPFPRPVGPRGSNTVIDLRTSHTDTWSGKSLSPHRFSCAEPGKPPVAVADGYKGRVVFWKNLSREASHSGDPPASHFFRFTLMRSNAASLAIGRLGRSNVCVCSGCVATATATGNGWGVGPGHLPCAPRRASAQSFRRHKEFFALALTLPESHERLSSSR